jgi:hypothetical protein
MKRVVIIREEDQAINLRWFDIPPKTEGTQILDLRSINFDRLIYLNEVESFYDKLKTLWWIWRILKK